MNLSWVERPRLRSLILYGDPGSGKTAIARFLSESLNWPIIILSPPHFLGRGGLDGFEVAAQEVFSDLLRLRRVVVLFDECEDFFKTRKDGESGNRTIGAFITAGMLPRIEALADRNWIIFLLATNSKLDDLDQAVRRHGRFDRSQEMNQPCVEAQKRYIKKQMVGNARGAELVESLSRILEQEDEKRNKEEPRWLGFFKLDRLVDQISADTATRRCPTDVDLLSAYIEGKLEDLQESKIPPEL